MPPMMPTSESPWNIEPNIASSAAGASTSGSARSQLVSVSTETARTMMATRQSATMARNAMFHFVAVRMSVIDSTGMP